MVLGAPRSSVLSLHGGGERALALGAWWRLVVWWAGVLCALLAGVVSVVVVRGCLS
jgi:hypothetical protein